MTELLYIELSIVADGVQRDIQGDFPGVDTNYDMYIEELRDNDGRAWFGVIDMGDAYQGAYVWNGKWEWIGDDPVKMRDRIIKQRSLL